MRLGARFLSVVALVGLALSAAGSGAGAAAAFPERSITIIVPFAAGGSVDRMTRGLTPFWEKKLGAQIQVRNVEGAGGITGIRTFLAAPDDGYTLLLGTDPYLSTGVFRGGGYKITDFHFVNIQQFDPATLVVRKDSPYKTLDDLINAAKTKPREVSWGTAVGGAPHILGSMLFEQLKADVRFVPYQSGGPARLAVLGGHIDAMGGTVAGDMAAMGDQGHLLAVAAPKRFPAAPDVPTFDEALSKYGVKVPLLGSIRFLAVHASLPAKQPERFKKLVDSYRATLESPEYKEYLVKAGEESVTQLLTPEEATRQFRQTFETMQQFEKLLVGN
jgi:tripartite-type tricarboxylate transporter receptor subunit TctC